MALSMEKLGDIYAAFFQSLLEESDVRATRITVDERITGTSAVPAAYSTGLDDSLVHDVYISTAEGSTGNVYQCTLGGDASAALWQYKFTIPAGAGGADAHVYFKYAAAEPTADGDMLDTPNAWIGLYAGTSAAAPTAYTAYTWYQWDSPPQPSDAMPLMDGTPSPGTGSEYSRNGHRHPSDTSKANKAIVSAEYNASSTYAPGAFCLHDNDFYECTTAIDMPEAWNASHWTQRTIGYVLTVLNNTKATAAQGALADTALQPGDVVNDLDTMDDDALLSAAQGKALHDEFLSSCLWRESAGNPVSVYPVPESPLSVKVSGQYTQEGAGDPSPENVRRITPWVANEETVTVKRTGKNLLRPNVWEQGVINANTGDDVASSDRIRTQPVSVSPGTAYVFSVQTNLSFLMWVIYHDDMSFSRAIGSTSAFTPAEDETYIRFVVRKPDNDTVTPGEAEDAKIQLELGTSATAYEPYKGDEITLTAPANIWGGWIDNEGKAADNWIEIKSPSISASDNIADLGSVLRIIHTPSTDLYSQLAGITASHFRYSVDYAGDFEHWYTFGGTIRVFISKARLVSNDSAGVNAWIAGQEAAGTPTQFLCQPAVSAAYTMTAASLSALTQADRVTPSNNVFTFDKGDCVVQYVKSPIREADEVHEILQTLLAE